MTRDPFLAKLVDIFLFQKPNIWLNELLMRSAFANEAVIFGRNRSEMVRDDKNDPVQSLDSPPAPTNSDGSHFLLSFLERLINKFGPFRDVSEIRVFRL